MVIDGCRWVRMGADGCGGVQGHGRAQKQHKQSQKWPYRALFWRYGRGKFPRTSCFAMPIKKWRGWVLAGKNGLVCMRWDVFAVGDRKKRGNEAKIRDQGMFCRGGREQQNSMQLAGVVRWRKRIFGGKKDRATGVCNLFIHQLKIIMHIFMEKLKNEANTSNQ